MTEKDFLKRIEEFEKLIKSSVEKPKSSYFKYVSVIITILVLLFSSITSYTKTTLSLGNVQDTLSDLTKATKNQDLEITDIKLKAVKDSTRLENISKQVDEINKKLETMNTNILTLQRNK